MQKYLSFTTIFFCFAANLFSQNVGIGTNTPHSSSKLEISDTLSGILIPRLTTNQIYDIPNPAKGLMVFDNEENSFRFFDGIDWVEQINDSNSLFEKSGNVIRNKNHFQSDNFLFGANSINNSSIGIPQSKMFYNKGKYAFKAGGINNLNWNTDSLGMYSCGLGYNSLASAPNSISLGYSTKATDNSAIAIGYNNHASGLESIAIGAELNVHGLGAIAIGYLNESSSEESIVIGNRSNSFGVNSTTIGFKSESISEGSMAIGYESMAIGLKSLALGVKNRTNSPLSTTIGYKNIANGYSSLVTGLYNDTIISMQSDTNSSAPIFTIGNGNEAQRSNALTTFYNGDFILGASILEYDINVVTPQKLFYKKEKSALRVGYISSNSWDNNSLGYYSLASGYNTTALGFSSLASGVQTYAKGYAAVALGRETIANGITSFSSGQNTITSNDYTTAMGYYSEANGSKAFAAGDHAISTASNSVTMGLHTETTGVYGTTIGRYNSPTSHYLFTIGNGTSLTNRKNSVHIYRTSDNAYFQGDIRPMTNGVKNLGSSNYRWAEVWATNGVIQTSDTTLKRDIEPLDYGLEDLMKINTISYKWKNSIYDDRKIGFNAQNLLKIIPEVVIDKTEIMDEETGETTYKNTKTLGVAYSELIPVLTKSIQEQQQLILNLQNELNQLKTIVSQK